MNKYGQAAIKATELSKLGNSPIESWEKATIEIFGDSTSQKKVCPKSTFLALAEKGLVKNILPGSYAKAKENKEYAIKAIEILKQNKMQPSTFSTKELWNKVQNIDKKHNSQMDVVLALWNNNLIKKI
ncbi:MAG: hypothetical protein Q8S41_03125 [Lutibacter sp.]|nr:hypothetical protein [Lutibacter sp.]